MPQDFFEYIYIMALSNVLSVVGALEVTETTLTTDLQSFADNLTKTVTAQYATADRSSAFTPAAGVQFYIMVEKDLNAQVTNPSSELLGFSGFTVAKADTPADKVTINLPTFTSKDVNTGTITFNGTTGLTNTGEIGTFTSKVSLSMTDQGVITSTVTISGNELTVTAADDVNIAQVVTDGLVAATADQDSADVLSASLTAAELTAHFADEITAINALYNNQDIISSWRITIDDITADENSTIAKYSRNDLSTGQTYAAPFGVGKMIVAATYYELQITLTDATGASVNMYDETQKIYGVLKHAA